MWYDETIEIFEILELLNDGRQMPAMFLETTKLAKKNANTEAPTELWVLMCRRAKKNPFNAEALDSFPRKPTPRQLVRYRGTGVCLVRWYGLALHGGYTKRTVEEIL